MIDPSVPPKQLKQSTLSILKFAVCVISVLNVNGTSKAALFFIELRAFIQLAFFKSILGIKLSCKSQVI